MSFEYPPKKQKKIVFCHQSKINAVHVFELQPILNSLMLRYSNQGFACIMPQSVMHDVPAVFYVWY